MKVRCCLLVDEKVIGAVRDIAHGTGYDISRLAEAGMKLIVEQCEAENGGPYPPRPENAFRRRPFIPNRASQMEL